VIGTRISAYEVLSELGSGGMGSVYLAKCAEEAAGMDEHTKVALMHTPRVWKHSRFLPACRVATWRGR